jgi:transposase
MAIKGRRSTPEERLRAVQLLKEGNEAALAARMFGVSRAIVFRWQSKYDKGGPAELETKKTTGPASRLSLTRSHPTWQHSPVTGSSRPRQWLAAARQRLHDGHPLVRTWHASLVAYRLTLPRELTAADVAAWITHVAT